MNERRPHVLYITYNGLTEPLGRRQVLPYVVALAGRGWPCTVVSFEKRETATAEAIRAVRSACTTSGIRWIALRYHRRPTVPATAFDVWRGWFRGLREGRQAALIHARASTPAVVAYGLSRTLRVPWIYDVRGFMAEEYVDAGHWRRGGVLHRATARMETYLLERASGVVLLTERIRTRLRTESVRDVGTPVAVIPSSVDLDTFRPSSREAREQERTRLGLGPGPVLVYSGSLGSWYRLDAMLDFLGVARRTIPKLEMLVLSPQPNVAEELIRAKRLQGSVTVRSLAPDAVPAALAACDAGICFLADRSSKHASSPTKLGEYLASGLPVITDRHTGDAGLLEGEDAWIVVGSLSEADYEPAALRLGGALADRDSAAHAARGLAHRQFDLERAVDRYEALYRDVVERR